MIRGLYSIGLWLASPLLRRKLRKRALAEPGYGLAVPERFGHYTQPPSQGWVWVHAVSLGETRAAAILLAALRRAMPDMRLLLTHGTATGRAEGQSLLRAGDVQVWQPWDTPGAVQRFVRHFQPRIGILMETEIWPNLLATCQAAGIPVALANARLSPKSLRQAQRLSALSRPAYGALSAVWAQTEADAQRLLQAGTRPPQVLGNLKFDASPNPAQLVTGRAWRHGAGRPVVLLASAREGEELMLLSYLKSFRAVAQQTPAPAAMKIGVMDVQWLIVPRHPQRFDAVAELVQAQGFSLSRRSSWVDAPEPADVWLGDSLGEMALYYGLADLALLGGSFEPLGGQNLIEAAACGCAMVMGPSTFNFAEAAELAEAAGAACRVVGMPEAVAQALAWLNAPQQLAQAAAAGPEFAGAHRGAAQKTAAAVQALLAA
ncbi:3-deoxy-D-manno-octulosonic-acid transferase [Rhodoferax sp. OV413]|uniref:3-deoxy-D-manno-octulosonic acid transferase n=1 Tax=Rhodoferax sp. OV413 TaxID=1855285 RepID=UPI000891AF0E|nr:3-deoxy-D-manno-octulosonic acid transferase [Rhodoferax sp. OV413]SDP78336.1 3-deoxy-D-manno-octulosonic-acid transferase [Rhodoferax sp. OV413]